MENHEKYAAKPPWMEAELAYLAGFMDGEGCFNVQHSVSHRKNGKSYEQYYPQFCVTNTNEKVIRWIQSRFGGQVHLNQLTKKNPRHKDAWTLRFRLRETQEIVPLLLPYLIVKREQAELMLEYIAIRSRQRIALGGKAGFAQSPYTPEQVSYRTRLAALNRKGPPPTQ